jgi:hypothetical protein
LTIAAFVMAHINAGRRVAFPPWHGMVVRCSPHGAQRNAG